MKHIKKLDRYSAFISYSHDGDHHVAKAVQNLLGRIARPWYRRRQLAIFRDESDLAADPDAWGVISQGLDQSEFLLLLASPEAKGSKWVNKEVQYWLEKHEGSPKNILIGLTDGVLEWNEDVQDFNRLKSTALPDALYDVFPNEPLWVDFRGFRLRKELTKRNPVFFHGCARIASTLVDCPLHDLISEDVRQHRRTMILAWSTGLSLMVLSLATTFATIRAVQKTKEALVARELSDANAWSANLRRVAIQLRTSPQEALDTLGSETDFPPGRRGLAWDILYSRSQHTLGRFTFPSPVKAMGIRETPQERSDALFITQDGSVWSWNTTRSVPTRIHKMTVPLDRNVQFGPDGGQVAVQLEKSVAMFKMHGPNMARVFDIPVACDAWAFDPANHGFLTYGDKEVRWWNLRDGSENLSLRYPFDVARENEEYDGNLYKEGFLDVFSATSQRHVLLTMSMEIDGGEFHETSGYEINLVDQTESILGFLPYSSTVLQMIPFHDSGRVLLRSQFDDRATHVPSKITLGTVQSGSKIEYTPQSGEATCIGSNGTRHVIVIDGKRLELMDQNLSTVLKVISQSGKSHSEVSDVMISKASDRVYVLDESDTVTVYSGLQESLRRNPGVPGSYVADMNFLTNTNRLVVNRFGPGSEDHETVQWDPEVDVTYDEYIEIQDPESLDPYQDNPNWVEISQLNDGRFVEDDLLQSVGEGRVLYVSPDTTKSIAYVENEGGFDLLSIANVSGTSPQSRTFKRQEDEEFPVDLCNQAALLGDRDGQIDLYRFTEKGGVSDSVKSRLPGEIVGVKLSSNGEYAAALVVPARETTDRTSLGELEGPGVSLYFAHLPPTLKHVVWRKVRENVSDNIDAVCFHPGSEDYSPKLLFHQGNGHIGMYDLLDKNTDVFNTGYRETIDTIFPGSSRQMLVTGSVKGQQVATKLFDLKTRTLLYELRISGMAVVKVSIDTQRKNVVLATTDASVWWLPLHPPVP